MRSLALLVIVACGPGGDQFGRGEPGLLEFERRMCHCRDKECATKVIEDMAAWTKRIPANAPKPDPATAAKSMERYNECMAKAIAAK